MGPSVGRVGEEAVAAVDRAIRVLAAIDAVASAEGMPVAVHHVCVACAAAMKAKRGRPVLAWRAWFA